MALGYCTVRVNVGALIIDGVDDNDEFDDVPVAGNMVLTPMLDPGKPVQVDDNGVMKLKAIAPFAVDIGLSGDVSHRGRNYVKVPAPTSATSNLSKLQWRASFNGLKFGSTSVSLPQIFFWAEPGVDVNLADHINVGPSSTSMQLSRGPRGFGVKSVEADGGDMVFRSDADGAPEIGRVPLPVGSGGLPDGGVTTDKLAADAVTRVKLAGAVRSELDGKASADVVSTALGAKADVSALAGKADKSTVDLALSDKADKSALALKADTSALAGKLGKSEADGLYAPKSIPGVVKSVNGTAPDGAGNVTVATGGGGQPDTVDTLGGTGAAGRSVMKAADAAAIRALIDAVTPAQVSAAVAALVDSSPATLDTLKELAGALGNDPNFAATIAGQIGAKYTKPASGIPLADLVAAVQASLGKADTASQPGHKHAAVDLNASGTRDATTFLRGDNTWSKPITVELPPGGTEGQMLVKSGTGLAWANVPSGPSSSDGPLALASPAYKTAAKSAKTVPLKIFTIGDSTNDGFGNPGGPDQWSKTWPLKLAELLRAEFGVAAGGRGWIPTSTPLLPGSYVYRTGDLGPAGNNEFDELNNQTGIPGSLWMQRGHATRKWDATFNLTPGTTAIDICTTRYGTGIIDVAPANGAASTLSGDATLEMKRITNPGASVQITPREGVGYALNGIIEYVGDEAVGVRQYNFSQGAMATFEYAGWLTSTTHSLKAMIGAVNPHVVLMTLGANDFSRGRTLAEYKTALTTIRTHVMQAAPNTVLVPIIRPWDPTATTDATPKATWDQFSTEVINWAAPLNVPVLDLRGKVPASGGGLYLSDKVHFTEAGNTAFANAVRDYMKIGS